MMNLRTKKWHKLAIFIVVTTFSSFGFAGKLDLLVGAFSLSAKTANKSGSTSTVGSYHLNYAIPMANNIDIDVGYTLMMAGTVGGDLGFGFDVGASYYIMAPSAPMTGVTPTSYMSVNTLWRPFVSFGFHQREFQSIQSNYAGFSVSGGVDRALDYSFDLKTFLRIGALAGPGNSSATEITWFVGVTFP